MLSFTFVYLEFVFKVVAIFFLFYGTKYYGILNCMVHLVVFMVTLLSTEARVMTL